MLMTIVVIQDFWTGKRIVYTVLVVINWIMGVFAGIGILYVAGFY